MLTASAAPADTRDHKNANRVTAIGHGVRVGDEQNSSERENATDGIAGRIERRNVVNLVANRG